MTALLVLTVPCPTCKAPAGVPCEKRGNLHLGGPNHLTRADKWMRQHRRSQQ